MNYYNEIDPHTAQWLRNMVSAGVLPPGDVDERSIEDVTPNELRAYTQCHFFAGIGGWSYALDLAGWPRDRPVWTGSCPCQSFSQAGKGAGFEDERHLWPAFQHLIAQCGPPDVLGEQVASKDADPWIDLVQADLEGMGYAFGGVAFPAASVGAPHIRDRTYWAAHADGERREGLLAPFGAQAPGQGWANWPEVVQSLRSDPERLIPGIGKPLVRPLVDGVSARVGRLRAYGNAIVPQQAAAFVRAYLESRYVARAAA